MMLESAKCSKPLALTLIAIFFCALSPFSSDAQEVPEEERPMTEIEVRTKAIAALRQGDTKTALEAATQLGKQFPSSPAATLTAADTFLRCGKPEVSLEYFDRYLKDEPDALPYLWQRGIAQYFSGKYEAGVKQFEVHRSVNPNDVENAAWHFLCLARADSFAKATQLVLPAPNDPRIPMEEVLLMLKDGDVERVKQRVQSVPATSSEKSRAEFYGYFYLGLYADAQGETKEALDWLKKSAADAPHHYMGDVARVYVQYLEREVSQK